MDDPMGLFSKDACLKREGFSVLVEQLNKKFRTFFG
jgi:hypothetical protein